MRLSAPTKNVFYISLLVAVVALLSTFVDISYVTDNAFWFLLVGYVLLVAGNTMKGF
ncbi:MAG: hypothetical protein N2C13_00395 [Chloroflexota bacterium]